MLTCPPSTTRFAPGLLKNMVAGAVGVLAVGVLAPNTIAQVTEDSPTSAPHATPATLTATNSATHLTAVRSLPDGIYLYGQSPRPNQVGSAYMVLQVKDRQVAGAFYMPFSSFDCFQGEIRDQQLALTVANREEQTRYPYSLALQTQGDIASSRPEAMLATPAGYHAISSQVSPRDRQILATCQSAR